MQTKAKANSLVTHRVVSENVIGFTVQGFDEIVLDMAKLNEANIKRAAMHGLIQRVTDMAAVPVADKEGNITPRADRMKTKYERMLRVVEHFMSGAEAWSLREPRAVRGASDHSLTIRAMMERFSKDSAGVDALIEGWVKNGHGTRTAILDSFAARADIAALITGYRAESASGIDTDALMAQIEE